jgi:hypothetical protein
MQFDLAQLQLSSIKTITQPGLRIGKSSFVLKGFHVSSVDQQFQAEINKKIDAEVRRLVSEAETRATEVLTKYRSYLEIIANRLLTDETLEQEAFHEIVKDIIPADKRTNVEFKEIVPDVPEPETPLE